MFLTRSVLHRVSLTRSVLHRVFLTRSAPTQRVVNKVSLYAVLLMRSVPLVPKGRRSQFAGKYRSKRKLYTQSLSVSTELFHKKPWTAGDPININTKHNRDFVLAEVNSFYKKERPTTWMRGVIILHDNSTAHGSTLVQEYLAQENVQTLPQPTYLHNSCSYIFFFV